ncbi:MAG: glycosyltransferase involved in cell wall biosynthesis [Kiritimatiellia bacterium]
MKIHFLVPGTGNFFCGTCLRDHTLVRELRLQGHEVTVLEMYLPHVLEEVSHDNGPLFFGGINCYLQQKFPLFRKTPRWLDKLFDHRKLIRNAMKHEGMTDAHELAAMTLSMQRGDDGFQVKELSRLVNWIHAQPEKPDVVVLSNAMLSGVAKRLKAELGCKIVCTLQGEDCFIETLGEYTDQVWDMLNHNAQYIDVYHAVSASYAEKMKRCMRLSDDQVKVVYNGVHLDGFAPADAPPEIPVIGFLSRMCGPKGLESLVDAWLELKQDPAHGTVRLHIGGSQVNQDVKFVAGLQAKIRAAGFGDDVRVFPNMSRAEKQDFLRGLSFLCTPPRYDEAFGLYILEALASGVPVVLPDRGGFPELVNATGGGLICPADDLVGGFRQALADLPGLRQKGLHGREIVQQQFAGKNMADAFLRAGVVDPR